MKTFKTILAILFLGGMFMGCEAESINDEVGYEIEDVIGTDGQNAGDDVQPPGQGG